MKRGFILLLLFVVFFGAGSFANGETEDSEKPSNDMEAKIIRWFREMQDRRTEKFDGREAVIRIYDNWIEDRAEFKQIPARFSDNEIIFDFNEIDESAFVVMMEEDQFDEELKGMLSSRIYAESYKEGVPLKISHRGTFPFEFNFVDAQGNPFYFTNVNMFIYGKDGGRDSRILVKEIEPDESGFSKLPSITGSLEQYYLVLRDPDNFGVVVLDSAGLEYLRLLTVKLPWISQETEHYEDTLWCVVVDDSNSPVSSASVISDAMSFWNHSDGLKLLTDEQGRFSLYVPRIKAGDGTKDITRTARKYDIRIDAPVDFGLLPFTGTIPNKLEHVIKMSGYGYFHTFAFEGEGGKIIEFERLSDVDVEIEREGKPTLEYDDYDLKDGGYFPLGVYKAEILSRDGNFTYEPMEVTKDSPEELVFRIDKGFTYYGWVVDGITGEPIEGAFVLGAKASNFMLSAQKNIANITDEQWDQLHRMNKDSDDGLLGKNFNLRK